MDYAHAQRCKNAKKCPFVCWRTETFCDDFNDKYWLRMNWLTFGEHWLTGMSRHFRKKWTQSGDNSSDFYANISRSLDARALIFGGQTHGLVLQKSDHLVQGLWWVLVNFLFLKSTFQITPSWVH